MGKETHGDELRREIRVRTATLADLPDIASIYNHAILNTTTTFDTMEKSVSQWRSIFARHSNEYPLLVAEADARVVGWGALRPFGERPAYRLTVENAVYIDPEWQGRGVGSALLGELVARARANGYHTILALVVGGNAASARLHLKHGFKETGMLREVGRKFDQWLDIIVFQCPLEG